jgi:hypothetical protein
LSVLFSAMKRLSTEQHIAALDAEIAHKEVTMTPVGQRHKDMLTQVAYLLRSHGFKSAVIVASLAHINANGDAPPLPDPELWRIALHTLVDEDEVEEIVEEAEEAYRKLEE